MNTTNIAFLHQLPTYRVREDRGDYDVDSDTDAAAADAAKEMYEAQRQIGDALNLTGLLSASLEDLGDSRAMQVHTVMRVIEKKLEKAYNQLDRHDANHTELLLAYNDLKDKTDQTG